MHLHLDPAHLSFTTTALDFLQRCSRLAHQHAVFASCQKEPCNDATRLHISLLPCTSTAPRWVLHARITLIQRSKSTMAVKGAQKQRPFAHKQGFCCLGIDCHQSPNHRRLQGSLRRRALAPQALQTAACHRARPQSSQAWTMTGAP